MTRAIQVLLIEDQPEDAELVLLELQTAGLGVESRRVQTEADLAHALDHGAWDVILSDFSMASYDGLRAFEMVQARALDIPFIFVSGALGEERAVQAMRAGARDCVLKGNLRRLPAAVLRELGEAENRRRQRAAEAELTRSERRYRSIFASASAALIELDLSRLLALDVAVVAGSLTSPQTFLAELVQCRVIDANAAALALFGAEKPQGLMPRLWYAILPVALELWNQAKGAAESTHPVEVELRLEPAGATPRQLVASARVPASPAEWRDLALTLFDITERRMLEARLHVAERMEAIGRLASGVAHDFNNLLTIIGTSAEFVRDDLCIGDSKADDIEVVLRAVEKAAALTNQLLSFSRRRPQRPELLDLNIVMTETERLMRRVIGEDIAVEALPGADIAAVLLDPTHAEQVLMNLCANAREAMPSGGTLSIRTHNAVVHADTLDEDPQVPPGAYVVLEVTDTGVGMDAATRARAFEPFFTARSGGNGTGLGLATVQGIVEQSGGHIRVESELGVGTSFRIYLPRREGAARSPTPIAAPGRAIRRDATILVVEDDDTLRATVRRLFERDGYRVLDARDGTAALALVEEHDAAIALMLVDVIMPGMSGRVLAQRVLADRPRMRVLFISGHDGASVARGLDDGDIEVLEKPFTGPALLARVRAIIAAH